MISVVGSRYQQSRGAKLCRLKSLDLIRSTCFQARRNICPSKKSFVLDFKHGTRSEETARAIRGLAEIPRW